jgi:hypothetical protein
LCAVSILVLSALAVFIFCHAALLVVVHHPFSASGAVAVSSGRGASGSAFIVRVQGGAMVNGSAVGMERTVTCVHRVRLGWWWWHFIFLLYFLSVYVSGDYGIMPQVITG